MQDKGKGFTLIELLVVIAIIAILAAILFPVFARAREQARAITCVSNVKQIALAVLMYTQDNDGNFPMADPATANAIGDIYADLYRGVAEPGDQGMVDYANLYGLRTQMNPYMKNYQLWKCASDSGPVTSASAVIGRRSSSYYLNFFVATAGNAAAWWNLTPAPWNEAATAYPSQYKLFNELIPYHDNQFVQNPYGWYLCYQPTSKITIAFFDGHAKAHPIDKVIWRYSWLPEPCYDPIWPRLGWPNVSEFRDLD
ncbi:MAG: prepilin-type N-terminal cleavage/methylation domain-containing protein [Chthonomonadales bacterium]|nr:prepilin-type N-terminal cleavage/methylation domain-containing protein [Chthonomonadales bacterium]